MEDMNIFYSSNNLPYSWKYENGNGSHIKHILKEQSKENAIKFDCEKAKLLRKKELQSFQEKNNSYDDRDIIPPA